MRRDSNDKKWQECKKKVFKKYGHSCLICKCLNLKEMIETKKLSSLNLYSRIDPAHIYPVSIYPEIMYDENNILPLCRHHHTLIDDYQDVVTGENIQENKVFYWWWRAKFCQTSEYDESIDYKKLLKDFKVSKTSMFDTYLTETENEDFDINKYL